jgi:hypothetical protein
MLVAFAARLSTRAVRAPRRAVLAFNLVISVATGLVVGRCQLRRQPISR